MSPQSQTPVKETDMYARVKALIAEGMDKNEAIKKVMEEEGDAMPAGDDGQEPAPTAEESGADEEMMAMDTGEPEGEEEEMPGDMSMMRKIAELRKQK